jgi:hypothetical protein
MGSRAFNGSRHVSERDLNWKYVDESVVETDADAKARKQ